jgi:hypothetical protein
MKTVGGRHYVHLSAVAQLGPAVQHSIRAAMKLARERGCDHPDIVSVKTGSDPYPIGLAWVDDFDNTPEPVLVQSMRVEADGTAAIRLAGDNPQIYHGKELMVDPGYSGFDRTVAMQRRALYMRKAPDPLRMGRKNWWDAWCAQNGI